MQSEGQQRLAQLQHHCRLIADCTLCACMHSIVKLYTSSLPPTDMPIVHWAWADLCSSPSKNEEKSNCLPQHQQCKDPAVHAAALNLGFQEKFTFCRDSQSS